jgi:hypothetical protein
VLEGAKAAAEPATRARVASFILDLLDVDKLDETFLRLGRLSAWSGGKMDCVLRPSTSNVSPVVLVQPRRLEVESDDPRDLVGERLGRWRWSNKDFVSPSRK